MSDFNVMENEKISSENSKENISHCSEIHSSQPENMLTMTEVAPAPRGNQDELIMAQEQRIADDIKASSSMVGPRLTLEPLEREFAHDQVYSGKVKELQQRYSHMRRTRPDGNCFLRGFIFAYLEYCITHRAELARFKKYIEGSKAELFELGFPKFTTEDFHEMFVEVLGDLEGSGSIDRVEAVLNDAGSSDYLVVYLRLLISAHLQKNADFFTFFIEGGRTVEEFCKQEVEPMYRECDHLHIVALTSALAVPVCVLYMDRGDTTTAAAHVFPEDAKQPLLYLLYRPGHYDVLYPRLKDGDEQGEESLRQGEEQGHKDQDKQSLQQTS